MKVVGTKLRWKCLASPMEEPDNVFCVHCVQSGKDAGLNFHNLSPNTHSRAVERLHG